MSPKLLPIDMDYVTDVLVRLLECPSPSGRTDDVMRLLGNEIEDLGLRSQLTRRGSLVADLDGEQDSPDRAVLVHADTIGCMVKDRRGNGRLQVVPIGTFSARFAEGARVHVYTDDPDVTYTGTILPLKSSGHTYGDAVDTQPIGWDFVEVRVDEEVASVDDLVQLGIRVGDFVALDAQPVVTSSGFVKSRHLDDKAGVAAALGAFKAILDAGIAPPVSAHLLVTIAEEIGQGASHGLHADVAEMVSIDNAVIAPGQQSKETGVNVAMQDSTGPFDFHLTRKLLHLCDEMGITAQRDVFNFYRSDVAAAIESGAETRAALIGFGVDASHGHERTHLEGIRNVAELVAAYLQTPLLFSADVKPMVPVEEFPSQEEAQKVRGYPADPD
ncbi:osmoprotectant NAGGN system M42 family peptidase [soil metagenome]